MAINVPGAIYTSCPNNDPAQCDNKGACGICLMAVPQANCDGAFRAPT